MLLLDYSIYLGIGCVASLILLAIVMKRKEDASPIPALDLADLLTKKRTSSGTDLATLSRLSPVLVVFLRHAGCTFCRQAVCDVAKSKRKLEEAAVRIVFVHFGNAEASKLLFALNEIDSPETIYDDDQQLYRAFGLRRGGLVEVASPRVLWRGVRAGLLDGHGMGLPEGDVLQLPGVFLLENCTIVRSFRHKSAADRPDYLAIALPQK